MKVMMKVNMSTEEGNMLVKQGKLNGTIKAILEEQKPEAAYFTADYGKRTAFLFFDMQESSEIPKLAEPWFLTLGAGIDMRPVMAPEDLAKAIPTFEAIAKKYG